MTQVARHQLVEESVGIADFIKKTGDLWSKSIYSKSTSVTKQHSFSISLTPFPAGLNLRQDRTTDLADNGDTLTIPITCKKMQLKAN